MSADVRLLIRLYLVLLPLGVGWVVVGPQWGLQVGTLACAFQVLAEVTNDS
jgi:hypothetical protein